MPYISIKISNAELEKISYLKINTEANTKAGVLRKGLYHLYDEVKKRENSRNPQIAPTEDQEQISS